MKVLYLTVFLAVVATSFAAEGDVIEMTDDNFENYVATDDTTLVMFYAPWCGHCKRLKPEYEKAASILKNDDPPIVLAKIDCTEVGSKTCSQYSVSGYPTLKIFQSGSVKRDYSGPREADGIVKYMRSQVGPASKELKSLKDIEKFLSAQEVNIVGFFEKESDLKTTFLKYADKMRDSLRFGHTSYPEVLEQYKETDAIILYRASQYQNKFEESHLKFDGKSLEDLKAFVKKNIHGLVGHRTRTTIVDFEKPLIVAYYGVDYVKNAKGTNYWRNRILKVAKDFEGQLTFAISNKDDFQHEMNEFGYDYTGDKPVILGRNAANQKFRMEKEFSVENLKEFANDLLEDNLEPYLKSESIPDNNDGPVKVAVGKNFDDVVMNNDKDVLVEFYAPWCGHCKKLEPIYKELGEKLADENVEIVKMDATANDAPAIFEVQGYPTLYWAPKSNKQKPVRYEGGREVDDFIKYIAKHATSELKGWDRNGKEKKKTEL